MSCVSFCFCCVWQYSRLCEVELALPFTDHATHPLTPSLTCCDLMVGWCVMMYVHVLCTCMYTKHVRYSLLWMLIWKHKDMCCHTGSGDFPLAVMHGSFLKPTDKTPSVLATAI